MKSFSGQAMTIILTDDDADDREIFQSAINDLKIECDLHLFENGTQLLDYLRNDTNAVPDMVFLDLNMPGISGMESLEKIRNNSRFKTVPIITIYSTSSNQRDKVASLNHGADAYITKPNDYADLKRLLLQVIKTDWQNIPVNKSIDTFVIK